MDNFDRNGLEPGFDGGYPPCAGTVYHLAGGAHLWPRGRVGQIGLGDSPSFDCTLLIAAVIDELAGWVGAKTGGASWPGITIGLTLGLVGLLLFNAVGALMGALLRIAGYEYYRNKDWKRSFKAAGGYLGGLLVSLVARFGIGVVMVIIFTWQVWW